MKISFYILLSMIAVLAASCQTEKADALESFQNPVLGGDNPDPSIVRVGEDFYMTHSSFQYYPGLLVWHSTDLLNWKRIGHALHTYVGSVWAPDLILHDSIYYIYFPAGGTNWVVTASHPAGPWSEPANLNLPGFIDPGHVVDNDGNRYLYLSKGYLVQLAEDGLSTVGQPKLVYEGWEFPKSWSTECFCLESPKSTIRNGYFYNIVAQGGTAGPATSHMVVAARGTSPHGPFENSPYNPIVRTENKNERWWSQGHGTLVDDVDGNHWIMYHGYEKNFLTLGRQTLMLPIEWTDDDWFRIPAGVNSEGRIKKPAGKPSENGTALSDDFSGERLDLQWQFFKAYKPERVSFSDGWLHLKAEGKSFVDSSPLLVNSSDQKYEVTVEFDIDKGVTAGMCLFYNEQGNVRVAVDTEGFTVFLQKSRKITVPNKLGNKGHLRILNDENEVSFYFSAEGTEWERVERSAEVSGYHHNVFAEFLSLRAGLYAFGEGNARFRNFVYTKL